MNTDQTTKEARKFWTVVSTILGTVVSTFLVGIGLMLVENSKNDAVQDQKIVGITDAIQRIEKSQKEQFQQLKIDISELHDTLRANNP